MKMQFGKYREVPLTEIPIDYLGWLITLPNLKDELVTAVTEELLRRKPERESKPNRLTVPKENRLPFDLKLSPAVAKVLQAQRESKVEPKVISLVEWRARRTRESYCKSVASTKSKRAGARYE